MEPLVLVGSGMAILGAIGAHLYYRRKIEKLERHNAYIFERNINLRKMYDAANRKEQEARTAQYVAERDRIILESQQKEWSRRILATMTTQDAA